MSTYAQQQDVEQYIEGWVTSDPVALERLIRRAESDLEPVLFPINHALPPSQILAMSGAGGGTFALNWVGTNPASTPQELYNASPGQLQADLQAIGDIGLGNVTVVGKYPVWTLMWSKSWAQTKFTNYLIPLLTTDVSHLTPPGASVVVSMARGRKIDPVNDLNENQALALSNATCAQVEYRTKMGEAFFVRPQYQQVRGPDFGTTGKLPMISPKARRELSQSGLLYSAGRAVAGYARRGVGKGWPNY